MPWQEVFTLAAAKMIDASGTLSVLSYVIRGPITRLGLQFKGIPSRVPALFRASECQFSSMDVCAGRKYTSPATGYLPYRLVRGRLTDRVARIILEIFRLAHVGYFSVQFRHTVVLSGLVQETQDLNPYKSAEDHILDMFPFWSVNFLRAGRIWDNFFAK